MSVLNFDAKLCERTRRQLDAYLSNELLVETASEVARHLETCPACSHELESKLRVRDALRRAVLARPVPDRLGAGVHRRLLQAGPRPFWQGSSVRWALALGGVAFFALGLWATGRWLSIRRGEQTVRAILQLGVNDHLQCAIKGHNYPEVAGSAGQIREKLGPQYAGLLPVVEQTIPGFQVLEGHVCSVAGSPRKYVHFIARGKGAILSVILTRRGGESLPPGKFLAAGASGGVQLYRARLGGMDVIGFESNAYFGFVVSDLGPEEMVRITAPIAPALRDALDERAGAQVKPGVMPGRTSGGVSRIWRLGRRRAEGA